MRCRCLFAFLLILEPGRGFQEGLSFTGGLERVGDQSISIKLADRRVIDAMLPNAQALQASTICCRIRLILAFSDLAA